MDLKAMERAIGAYAPLGTDADRARLEFFAGLYRLQDEWANRVAAQGGYPAPAAEQVEAWYWNSEPVLSHAPTAIDMALFGDALADIAAYLVDNAGLEQEAAEALGDTDWHLLVRDANLDLAAANPSAFVESAVADAAAGGVNVPADLFGMVLTLALRCWLQPAAESVSAIAPRGRDGHDCPVACPICGSRAAASYVGESAGTGGRGRMQYCAMCGAQWPYERIRCGVCGTHNQTKLHYFNLEGDNAHRIQSCDACGQYQRVAFQEDIPGPLCMEVEDVVMAKLDQVALDPRFRKEAEN